MGVEARVGCTPSDVTNTTRSASLYPKDRVAIGRFEEKGKVGANVGGTFAKARGLFHILEEIEFALETGESILGRDVGVTTLFQKGFAVEKGHATAAVEISTRVSRKDREEHARTVFEGGTSAFDSTAAGLLCFKEDFYI